MKLFLLRCLRVLVDTTPYLALATSVGNAVRLQQHGGTISAYAVYVLGPLGVFAATFGLSKYWDWRDLSTALHAEPPVEADAGKAVFSLSIPGVSVRVAFDEEAAATKECRYRIVGAVEAALSVRTDAEEEEV